MAFRYFDARVTLEIMDGKRRLEETVFDSLDAMMAAFAKEASLVAKAEHDVRLDYSEASVRQLETILAVIDGAPSGGSQSDPAQLEYATKLWGGYLGEVLRRRYSGAWEMSVYPGGTLAVPSLEVKGSRLYPLMKVHRRLTLGAAEDVAAFFAMVVARLGDPVRAN